MAPVGQTSCWAKHSSVRGQMQGVCRIWPRSSIVQHRKFKALQASFSAEAIYSRGCRGCHLSNLRYNFLITCRWAPILTKAT